MIPPIVPAQVGRLGPVFWWSGQRAGFPAQIPPVPTQIRHLLALHQPMVWWFGLFPRILVPTGPVLVSHVESARALTIVRPGQFGAADPTLAQVMA